MNLHVYDKYSGHILTLFFKVFHLKIWIFDLYIYLNQTFLIANAEKNCQKVHSPSLVLKAKRKCFPTMPDKKFHSSGKILL